MEGLQPAERPLPARSDPCELVHQVGAHMIGTAELARVLARPPVNLEAIGITDPHTASEDDHATYSALLHAFWTNQGVDWPDVEEWALRLAQADLREMFAGVEMTLEEFDLLERVLTAKFLHSFQLGWMLAKGMGNESEEE